jgi:deoxyadenosine/deoxycytidine kinase
MNKNEITANYDESWKEALNEYFDSFLSFFFPVAYKAIDWTKPPESLDKELQQITASSKSEKRIADKLYKVWLLDKTPKVLELKPVR